MTWIMCIGSRLWQVLLSATYDAAFCSKRTLRWKNRTLASANPSRYNTTHYSPTPRERNERFGGTTQIKSSWISILYLRHTKSNLGINLIQKINIIDSVQCILRTPFSDLVRLDLGFLIPLRWAFLIWLWLVWLVIYKHPIGIIHCRLTFLTWPFQKDWRLALVSTISSSTQPLWLSDYTAQSEDPDLWRCRSWHEHLSRLREERAEKTEQ